MSVVSRFAQRIGLEGKSVVVVLDDVYRAIGLDEVDRYTKSLYEWIGYLHERYKASNVAIVLTTSEGMSKRILSKHTYVS
ncbi:MAG: ATP-binding protein, partial [Ignisphaera sp.]